MRLPAWAVEAWGAPMWLQLGTPLHTPRRRRSAARTLGLGNPPARSPLATPSRASMLLDISFLPNPLATPDGAKGW